MRCIQPKLYKFAQLNHTFLFHQSLIRVNIFITFLPYSIILLTDNQFNESNSIVNLIPSNLSRPYEAWHGYQAGRVVPCRVILCRA